MLNRRGVTLIELLVALVLAGVVLGAATTSTLRQQRTHARIASVASADVQLRAGTALLTSQLAFVSAPAGDLAAGEAQDTALQIRATVAVAVACATEAGVATFLPDPPGAVAISGVASQPRPGDSLWFLADSIWRGARVTGASLSTVTCPAPFSLTGTAIRLTLTGANDTIPAGAPLRVTRPTRYAFYRSGDGTWQLGFREWSESLGAFSSPQPVAGPFVRSSDGRRSRFRYFGADGAELAGAEVEQAVSRVRVMLYALSLSREAGQDSVRSDSIDVALDNASRR